MHRLALRVQRGQEIDVDTVRVLIDGVDLATLVRPVELPHATAEGHPEIAGAYDGLPPDDWKALPERYDTDDRVAVLACVCGEVGCWPLRVRIEVADRVVRWSDFQQPHRPEWSYAGFGPFVFDRLEYDTEIQRITRRRA